MNGLTVFALIMCFALPAALGLWHLACTWYEELERGGWNDE